MKILHEKRDGKIKYNNGIEGSEKIHFITFNLKKFS